jgi:hypothetical protein
MVNYTVIAIFCIFLLPFPFSSAPNNEQIFNAPQELINLRQILSEGIKSKPQASVFLGIVLYCIYQDFAHSFFEYNILELNQINLELKYFKKLLDYLSGQNPIFDSLLEESFERNGEKSIREFIFNGQLFFSTQMNRGKHDICRLNVSLTIALNTFILQCIKERRIHFIVNPYLYGAAFTLMLVPNVNHLIGLDFCTLFASHEEYWKQAEITLRSEYKVFRMIAESLKNAIFPVDELLLSSRILNYIVTGENSVEYFLGFFDGALRDLIWINTFPQFQPSPFILCQTRDLIMSVETSFNIGPKFTNAEIMKFSADGLLDTKNPNTIYYHFNGGKKEFGKSSQIKLSGGDRLLITAVRQDKGSEKDYEFVKILLNIAEEMVESNDKLLDYFLLSYNIGYLKVDKLVKEEEKVNMGKAIIDQYIDTKVNIKLNTLIEEDTSSSEGQEYQSINLGTGDELGQGEAEDEKIPAQQSGTNCKEGGNWFTEIISDYQG